MKDTIDLSELVFESGVGEYKENIRNQYGEEIGSKICSNLEEKNLFEWINVLSRKDDILDRSSFIGTKDLEIDSILEYEKLLNILHSSETVNWKDPLNFIIVLYRTLGDMIERKFDTDSQFIDYISNNTDMDDEGLDSIRDMHGDLYNNSSNLAVNLFSDNEKDYDSKIAKLYISVSNMYKTILPSHWDNEPEIGDYVVFSAMKEDKGGKILLKIEDIEKLDYKMSDIIESKSLEDDIVLEKQQNIIVRNVAHEDKVYNAYKNHFLLQDKLETNTLEPDRKSNVTFHKNNPLPFNY